MTGRSSAVWTGGMCDGFSKPERNSSNRVWIRFTPVGLPAANRRFRSPLPGADVVVVTVTAPVKVPPPPPLPAPVPVPAPELAAAAAADCSALNTSRWTYEGRLFALFSGDEAAAAFIEAAAEAVTAAAVAVAAGDAESDESDESDESEASVAAPSVVRGPVRGFDIGAVTDPPPKNVFA